MSKEMKRISLNILILILLISQLNSGIAICIMNDFMQKNEAYYSKNIAEKILENFYHYYKIETKESMQSAIDILTEKLQNNRSFKSNKKMRRRGMQRIVIQFNKLYSHIQKNYIYEIQVYVLVEFADKYSDVTDENTILVIEKHSLELEPFIIYYAITVKDEYSYLDVVEVEKKHRYSYVELEEDSSRSVDDDSAKKDVQSETKVTQPNSPYIEFTEEYNSPPLPPRQTQLYDIRKKSYKPLPPLPNTEIEENNGYLIANPSNIPKEKDDDYLTPHNEETIKDNDYEVIDYEVLDIRKNLKKVNRLL